MIPLLAVPAACGCCFHLLSETDALSVCSPLRVCSVVCPEGSSSVCSAVPFSCWFMRETRVVWVRAHLRSGERLEAIG
uniref:Putative secreted protein n=1 Tax=Anopheles darlingi TaxID=43151 RepID=A0A2M4D7M9_ANODA